MVLGQEVGYQVSMDKQTDRDLTALTYATTGILLERLVSTKSLSPFTHVLIDEGILIFYFYFLFFFFFFIF